MEVALNIVSIIIIVFGILQIILFFKLWGMTNNVCEMKNMMELFLRKEFQNKEDTNVDNFSHNHKIFMPGDIVSYKKTGENFKIIKNIGEGSYYCQEVGGDMRYMLNDSDLCESIKFEKEDFPTNAKFKKGDIVLYKAENIKLIIIEYVQPNVFKCAVIDDPEKTYCFQESFLEKI